jgi:hypothetical protein
MICSRCKKELEASFFGVSKKGVPFKTCINCRNYVKSRRTPNLEAELVEEPPTPQQEEQPEQQEQSEQQYQPLSKNNAMRLILEKLKSLRCDIELDLSLIVDKFLELQKKNILTDPEEIKSSLWRLFDRIPSHILYLPCTCPGCINRELYDNPICLFRKDENINGFCDIKLAFSCKDDIFHYNIPSVNLFDGFVKPVKLKDRRRCGICQDRKVRNFVGCGRCDNRMCNECFDNLTDRLTCSFCRYNLNEHINKRIDELDIRPICFIRAL